MKRLLSAALVGLLIALMVSTCYARHPLLRIVRAPLAIVGGPGPHGGGGGGFHGSPIHVEPFHQEFHGGGGYGWGVPNVLPYVAPLIINSLLPPSYPPALGYQWARVNGVWTQVPLGTIVGSAKVGDSADPLPAALAVLAQAEMTITADGATVGNDLTAVTAAQSTLATDQATQATDLKAGQLAYQAAVQALAQDYGNLAPQTSKRKPAKAKK